MPPSPASSPPGAECCRAQAELGPRARFLFAATGRGAGGSRCGLGRRGPAHGQARPRRVPPTPRFRQVPDRTRRPPAPRRLLPPLQGRRARLPGGASAGQRWHGREAPAPHRGSGRAPPRGRHCGGRAFPRVNGAPATPRHPPGPHARRLRPHSPAAQRRRLGERPPPARPSRPRRRGPAFASPSLGSPRPALTGHGGPGSARPAGGLPAFLLGMAAGPGRAGAVRPGPAGRRQPGPAVALAGRPGAAAGARAACGGGFPAAPAARRGEARPPGAAASLWPRRVRARTRACTAGGSETLHCIVSDAAIHFSTSNLTVQNTTSTFSSHRVQFVFFLAPRRCTRLFRRNYNV